MADDDKGFWVETLDTGIHTDSHGQEVELTRQLFDMAVSCFDQTKDLQSPPIRLGTHNPLGIAGGWVDGMRRVGDKLQVRFANFLPGIKELFEKKLFRKVSAGLDFGKEIGGKKWAIALNHVAVLGDKLPAIKTLQDIQALMGEERAADYVLSDPVEDDTRVFTVFEKEEENTMPDEHKIDAKAFDNLLTRFTELETNLSKATTAKSEADEKLTAETKRADEAEKNLKTQKVELAEKASKASLTELTEYCEAKVKDMKMSKAAKEALLKDVDVQFSESGEALIPWSAVKAFTEAGGLAPKGVKGLDGDTELGDPKEPDKELDAKVVELMEKTDGLSYSDAATRVLRANPDLDKAYRATHSGGEQ